jgi:hypothetical protein
MISAGATSAEVWHFAVPAAVTVGELPLPHVIGFPFALKITVPVGATGENAADPSCAVKVTLVPTVIGPVGEGVKASVGLSWLMVWLTVAAVAVLKLASPG